MKGTISRTNERTNERANLYTMVNAKSDIGTDRIQNPKHLVQTALRANSWVMFFACVDLNRQGVNLSIISKRVRLVYQNVQYIPYYNYCYHYLVRSQVVLFFLFAVVCQPPLKEKKGVISVLYDCQHPSTSRHLANNKGEVISVSH